MWLITFVWWRRTFADPITCNRRAGVVAASTRTLWFSAHPNHRSVLKAAGTTSLAALLLDSKPGTRDRPPKGTTAAVPQKTLLSLLGQVWVRVCGVGGELLSHSHSHAQPPAGATWPHPISPPPPPPPTPPGGGLLPRTPHALLCDLHVSGGHSSWALRRQVAAQFPALG
jgi:hypothetical protein